MALAADYSSWTNSTLYVQHQRAIAKTALSARIFIILAALLWSTGGAAVKLSTLSTLQSAGARALLAGIVLFVLLPQARRGYRLEVLVAGAFHAANCVLFVYANQQTTAGNVIFIQNIAPVWILLMSTRFTGDRPTRSEIWSVPISLIGCTLLFFDTPELGQLKGNLAALAASVLFALLILSYRRLNTDEGIAAVTAGNFMIAFGCLPWALFGPSPTPGDAMVIAYLGVFQQAFGHLLFIWGMSAVSALEGALLILIEPIASPGWAYLMVGERPGPWFAAGAGIVIAAQAGRILASRK
ncbi:MAG: DMT family transporter [Myxococcota bacterium]